jgi:hypothetical protein
MAVRLDHGRRSAGCPCRATGLSPETRSWLHLHLTIRTPVGSRRATPADRGRRAVGGPPRTWTCWRHPIHGPRPVRPPSDAAITIGRSTLRASRTASRSPWRLDGVVQLAVPAPVVADHQVHPWPWVTSGGPTCCGPRTQRGPAGSPVHHRPRRSRMQIRPPTACPPRHRNDRDDLVQEDRWKRTDLPQVLRPGSGRSVTERACHRKPGRSQARPLGTRPQRRQEGWASRWLPAVKTARNGQTIILILLSSLVRAGV